MDLPKKNIKSTKSLISSNLRRTIIFQTFVKIWGHFHFAMVKEKLYRGVNVSRTQWVSFNFEGLMAHVVGLGR